MSDKTFEKAKDFSSALASCWSTNILIFVERWSTLKRENMGTRLKHKVAIWSLLLRGTIGRICQKFPKNSKDLLLKAILLCVTSFLNLSNASMLWRRNISISSQKITSACLNFEASSELWSIWKVELPSHGVGIQLSIARSIIYKEVELQQQGW